MAPECTECGSECSSCRGVIAQLVADKRAHIGREVRESQRVEELRTDLAALRTWAEQALRLLGQLTHERDVTGMVLTDIEQRRELIDRGHRLLGYPLPAAEKE